ncbi:MAG: hypothetical protein Q7V14_03500 [Coriobacteriia bacterium]|nr:hypothetical protein [Coriobacteriia bacterium]
MNSARGVLVGWKVTIEQISPAITVYPTVETATNADGKWTAAVNGPGQYRVKFTNMSGTFVSEYYDNVIFTDPSAATPITVEDYGTHLSGIDAELDFGGGIWDFVTQGGVPVGGLYLGVWLLMGRPSAT